MMCPCYCCMGLLGYGGPAQERARGNAESEMTTGTDTYVLHVGAGKEPKTLRLVERIVEGGLVEEVFSPKYQKAFRRAGEWRMGEATLVPGYLFVRTPDAPALRDALWAVPAFTRMLSIGEELVPLGEAEIAWLEGLTSPAQRTVGFSRGYAVGDHVVVTSGPLIGRESQIVRIDRHKRMAWLNFSILGRTPDIKVGLEIVSRVPGKRAA